MKIKFAVSKLPRVEQSREFWKQLPGASPRTFHSLVNRGLLELRDNHFHWITPEGRNAL